MYVLEDSAALREVRSCVTAASSELGTTLASWLALSGEGGAGINRKDTGKEHEEGGALTEIHDFDGALL